MPSRISHLATPWRFIQSLKAVFSVAVAFVAGSSGLASNSLMILYTCFCTRSRAISVAHFALFVQLNLVMVMVVELILHDLISQSSVIVVSQTLREDSSSCRQTHSGMRENHLACWDATPWRCWPPLDKRKWMCWSSVLSFNTKDHNIVLCRGLEWSSVRGCMRGWVYCIVQREMSHRHKVDRWLMAVTTNEASYIIVLGIVTSVLPISSTDMAPECLYTEMHTADWRCETQVSSYTRG